MFINRVSFTNYLINFRQLKKLFINKEPKNEEVYLSMFYKRVKVYYLIMKLMFETSFCIVR